MIEVSYDLHIHSCLSPCGADESTPSNIAGLASLLGLDVIALTDHNTAKNCPALFDAIKSLGADVLPIAGMELTTEEEIHVICLFPTLEKAMEFDEHVFKRLLPIKNNPDIYGSQYVMDGEDNIIETVEKSLINATNIGIYELKNLIYPLRGIFIPAHIERAAFSLISTLGAVPGDCGFDTLEIRSTIAVNNLKSTYPHVNNCYIVHNSDAHRLEDISLPKNRLSVKEKTVSCVLETLSDNYKRFL
ncbi:MAG: PHP domain-containing protein [Eubacterium sp.]|jgi:PHP family Zn ribbon phosphoesterase|nr:PHP domain-containing protein [Eubacterium sp.]